MAWNFNFPEEHKNLFRFLADFKGFTKIRIIKHFVADGIAYKIGDVYSCRILEEGNEKVLAINNGRTWLREDKENSFFKEKGWVISSVEGVEE